MATLGAVKYYLQEAARSVKELGPLPEHLDLEIHKLVLDALAKCGRARALMRAPAGECGAAAERARELYLGAN